MARTSRVHSTTADLVVQVEHIRLSAVHRHSHVEQTEASLPTADPLANALDHSRVDEPAAKGKYCGYIDHQNQ